MGTFDKCPRPNLKFAKLLISFVGNICKDYLKAQTICNSEKLRISYIKAEKDTRKHIFWYFEGQKVVPQGPFGQTKLCFELEKRLAGAFWADKIVFWARKASHGGLFGG